MMRSFLIFMLCLWPWMGTAEPYPDHADLYVNDLAGIISPQVTENLRSHLSVLKEETGVEMTVLTIPSRSDYDASASIEAFATRLFNGWGIGDAARNDGILVLVIPEDREMRIELGSAYDQGFDPLAQDMVNRYFKPDFIKGDYSAGIEKGVKETITRIARPKAANQRPEAVPAGGGEDIGEWIFRAAIALTIGLGLFGRPLSDRLVRLRACPQCGRRTLWRHRHGAQTTVANTLQQGRLVTECRSCAYRDERAIPRSRFTSGSSGGSFGGGSSSGGGASGRW
ncbi:MAG: TPM domain-containing protein [Albidovulum sp.]